MRDRVSWGLLVVPGVVTFLGGILVSFVTQAAFNVLGTTEALLIGIAILTALMCFFAIGSIVLIRIDLIGRLDRARFSLDVFHSGKTSDKTKEFYDELYNHMRSATKSIRAVGLYKPSSLEATPQRSEYFSGLQKLLESKSKQSTGFVYERIVQVETVRFGVLGTDQIDALTFAHCNQLLDIQKRDTDMRTHLRQVTSILSPMSFFIIDDQKVVFLLPTVTPEGGTLKTLKLGTGLVISSQEGSFAREMLDLFDTLKSNGNEVLSTSP